ncbi:oligosaccharide flippase family protein [Chelatococcus sp. SYSU_G07232]|uniref:Oligosaccharide flippase family protein n=1 Tax=Chelatococcus albus TaxID=3047466 RepID=A0ABT7AJ25_9HYPH|nr:oligosaccharide flippase family protein [Chelatococcus sp. SYSU_G07232]MDJ1158992.1 oligosaccharide flippase family protein [Chelatococcus sp. SYSU_G07232]
MGSRSARDVAILVGGAIVAQGLPALLSPVLTRLYSPAEFGQYSLVSALAAFIAVGLTGRFELAIPLPRSDWRARNLVYAALLLAAVLAAVLLALALLWHVLAGRTLAYGWSSTAAAIAITAFFIAAYQTLSYFLIRLGRFRQMSLARMGQAVTWLGIAIPLGLAGVSGGLTLGYLAGWAAAAVLALLQLLPRLRSLPGARLGHVAATVRRYRDHAVHGAVPAMLDSASLSIPMVVLFLYHTTADVGQFNLTRQVAYAAPALLSTAVSQVFLRRISVLTAEGRPTTALFLTTARKLALVAAIYLAAVLLLAKPAITFLFGEAWHVVGDYALILAPSHAVRLVATPLSLALVATGRMRTLAMWQVSYFATSSVLFLFRNVDAYQLLVIYCIIDFALYAFYFLLSLRAVEAFDANQGRLAEVGRT